MTQRDDTRGVDGVVADPEVVSRAGAWAWCCLGPGSVGGGWGAVVGQGPVGPVVVVVVGEFVEQACNSGSERGCGVWVFSHFFMVCWNRSTLPQVVGWLGREFFWVTPSAASSVSKPLRPPVPPPAKRVV
nr:hypothetical protein [Nocardia stercoris]